MTGILGAAIVAVSLSGCGSDDKSSGSTDQISQGETIVQKFSCTSCHTANFSGDTNPQPGTMGYPANLTPDKDTGIGDWTTDQITTAILSGTDDDNETLCAPMPKFGSMGMSMADATNIAAYLKSLPEVSKMVPESSCAEKGGR